MMGEELLPKGSPNKNQRLCMMNVQGFTVWKIFDDLFNLMCVLSSKDSPFHCEMFYPGQSISGSSRVFRDVQWIQGPRPVFTNNQRVNTIVEQVSFVFNLNFSLSC